jgi:osmotically-inducible protein OsmY
MRRYQKWLSVGLMALTPGAAMAGLINGASRGGPVSSAEAPVAEQFAASSQPEPNQELAERVGKALQKLKQNGKLSGYDMQIDVREGVVTLDGTVVSHEQRVAAGKTSAKVHGVKGVNNRLRVSEPATPQGPIQQASASMPRKTAKPNMVRQANYQSAQDGRGRVQQVSGGPATNAAMLAQSSTAPVAIPAYGPPDAMGGHTIYNQPNLPNYAAWPTYAQYPNYAAVTYPAKYSASAWPYIGPFYPYPQVPLNWRKATLEWDAGSWNLSFDSKYNRWWWFLNPNEW